MFEVQFSNSYKTAYNTVRDNADPSLSSPSVFSIEFATDPDVCFGHLTFRHLARRWPTTHELFMALRLFLDEYGWCKGSFIELTAPVSGAYRFLKVECSNGGFNYGMEFRLNDEYHWRTLLHESPTGRINYDFTISTRDLFWLACALGYVVPKRYDRVMDDYAEYYGDGEVTYIWRESNPDGVRVCDKEAYVAIPCEIDSRRYNVTVEFALPRDITTEPGWHLTNECPFFGRTVPMTADEFANFRKRYHFD